jgi:dipeptidase E
VRYTFVQVQTYTSKSVFVYNREMKLFLASEAKHPKSVKRLEKFIDGFKGKRVVYIPTAANGEFYGSWKTGGSIRLAKSLGFDLEVVELEDYYKTDVIKKISEAEILWMAGGRAGYLLYWIRRVKLDKALPEILNKGTVYVGSSAGSMICAKTQEASDWYLGESEPGASLLPGLGYVDFEIYPHYKEKDLKEIRKHWKKGELYLLKDGEVITVEGEKVKAMGDKRVLKV